MEKNTTTIRLNQNKMKQEVKWTTKDGKVMLVDDMTEQHAKNALKMLIRNVNRIREEIKNMNQKPKFELHGDIAQDHYDQMMLHEYEQDMGIDMQDF